MDQARVKGISMSYDEIDAQISKKLSDVLREDVCKPLDEKHIENLQKLKSCLNLTKEDSEILLDLKETMKKINPRYRIGLRSNKWLMERAYDDSSDGEGFSKQISIVLMHKDYGIDR